ncbi:MAG: DUF6519 domain-containing protein [Terriglobia bacterium]
MKADLTRNTFDPSKHFTRVIMQQGRVQLDADWNEQDAILVRNLRAFVRDALDPAFGPPGSQGFLITPARAKDFQIGGGPYYVDGIRCEVDSAPVLITGFPSTNTKQVQVGDWIADGVQFEKLQYVMVSGGSSAPPAALVQITDVDPGNRILTFDTDVSGFKKFSPQVQHVITYLSQPDHPLPDPGMPSGGALSAGSYQVYLDVWERHITYIEDDSIREVALNGPDTATRAKLVCQVKVTTPCQSQGTSDAAGGAVCCTAQQLTSTFQPGNRGRLKARAKQASASTDPCIISPQARYRGPENQLYRVEIHTGSQDAQGNATTPTFKWSRENGSVVFPIVSMATASGSATTTVTLENLGRDDRLGLAVGEWVEIQDDTYVLQNRAEPLLKVQSIDRASLTVTLTGAPSSNVGQFPGLHPLLRRWDYQAGDPAEGGLQLSTTDNAALVQEDGNWHELEDGIQIQFQAPDAGQPPTSYRTSDYWLIPARTATGDVEWPIATDTQGNPELDSQNNTIPIALPPLGVQHHYAPLAVITLDSGGAVIPQAQNGGVQDCRKPLK